jgi:hypothetical protein
MNLSIVIPENRGEFLDGSLAYQLAHMMAMIAKKYEVLLINDGSSDWDSDQRAAEVSRERSNLVDRHGLVLNRVEGVAPSKASNGGVVE